MELKDYSTEGLKAELKRRSDLAKAEKAEVKRCRMCKHWGKITYSGKYRSSEEYEWIERFNFSKCCIFFKTKNGNNYRCHSPYQLACEHFEEKEVKL